MKLSGATPLSNGCSAQVPDRSPFPRSALALAPALLVGAAIAGIVLLERRRPLRAGTQPEPRRTLRNLALGALSLSTAALLEQPVVRPLARRAAERRRGLVQMLPIRAGARDLLAVLAMDYTIYLWHVAAHRVPFLWRFHQVHHLDLDLDSTTALRFHFGEMALSVPYRALQIVAIGTSQRALESWQRFFFVSVLFHHSNIRLPRRLERALSLLLATPRMHAIHHSVVPAETNSNWASGFSVWDRLHRTFRLDVPQKQIRIGPPGGTSKDELGVARSVALPFRNPATAFHA